jgi:hypothetical protein
MAHGLIKRDTIYAKLETTYGTDSVPVGSDAVLILSLQHAPDRLRLVPRPALTGALGNPQQAYAGMLESVTITAELRGSGTAGTAPEIGPLLRACGLSETIVASTSVTYAPQGGTIESCTIYYFKSVDGSATRVRHILLGCRGTAVFNAEAGTNGTVTFTMTGRRANPTDQSALTPTFDSTVPVAIRGLSCTLGGVSNLVIQGFDVDLGNQIVVPDNLNDSEGYGNITLTERDPVLTLRRHDELVATIAPFADLVAGTQRAFDSGVVGATAGNRWRFQAAQAAYRGLQPGEAEGLRTLEATFGCTASTVGGNDHFSLAFT